MGEAALALGGAECLWDDLRELEENVLGEPWPWLVGACNEAGADWPRRLDHWASYHPEKFLTVCSPGAGGAWIERRREAGHPDGYTLWSSRAEEIVDRTIGMEGGSSGLLVVRVLLKVGAERVVLCGMPMDERPHYHDGHGGEPWDHADMHWKEWERQRDLLAGRVRSMSGRTRRELGYPDREWIMGEEGE